MKYDLVCIGDTTVDIFLNIDEGSANVFCDLDKKECKLSLNYADKIPVKEVWRTYAAGNAANVAIGVSRLGLKTFIFTIVGDDDDGRNIVQTLKKEKVGTEGVVFDKSRGTNLSVILSYRGERTILSFHQPRIYFWPDIPQSRFLYFSSLAPGHEVFNEKLPDFIRDSRVKLAFNPGSYQLRQGLEVLRPILKQTYVLILNREEAERLFGPRNSLQNLLKKALEEGAKIAVITDGEKGSWASDGTQTYFLPSSGALPLDKTGAGDSYTAGFLSALMYGKDIKEGMRWGTLNASSVISKIGTHNGLLTKPELEKALQDRIDLQPEEI